MQLLYSLISQIEWQIEVLSRLLEWSSLTRYTSIRSTLIQLAQKILILRNILHILLSLSLASFIFIILLFFTFRLNFRSFSARQTPVRSTFFPVYGKLTDIRILRTLLILFTKNMIPFINFGLLIFTGCTFNPFLSIKRDRHIIISIRVDLITVITILILFIPFITLFTESSFFACCKLQTF
jgi:hypothetical protein